MKQDLTYQIIVVGGGHAGVEAAHISAKLGCRVALITMDPAAIGRMSCNPAIGGLAKGQIVREIDVLGGLMPSAADASGLQFKTLNKSKGRSVWSPRAQVDKRLYESFISGSILKNPNIDIISGECVSVLTSKNKVTGAVLRSGEKINSSCVILTCGTFMSGLIHVGDRKILAGRMGEERADGITESLSSLGFKTGRLKTGTPPRLEKNSIDWALCSPAEGDQEPIPFSYKTNNFNPPNELCYTTQTNKASHDIINKNLHLSPMFSGEILGTGPRYCPSIEDKIDKYKHHPSHTLFLEPEWQDSDQIYLNGFSTSLPESVQKEALRKIPALKNVEFFRPGYAIEYDYIPPAQIKATLETKDISGLFFAGQINGTSGYEEAAAQGLISGINASSIINNMDSLILDRGSSYIGVMIDDLITKDTLEPYRMFTSRAEYRILLRYSNTDDRLLKTALKHNLLSKDHLRLLEKRIETKQAVRLELNTSLKPEDVSHLTKIKQKTPARDILKRPECNIVDFSLFFKNFQCLEKWPNWSRREILFDIESEIKYDGYIKRLFRELKKQKKSDSVLIPTKTNYSSIKGLSNEAVEKLSFVRPETIGQATRVSGITPADISVLMVSLAK